MPGDFVVGTNPAGERTVVTCENLPVPFAFPKPGTIIGFENRQAASTDGSHQTRWCARWSETSIAYWILLVLLLVAPAGVAVSRILKRIRLTREHPHERAPSEPIDRATPHLQVNHLCAWLAR